MSDVEMEGRGGMPRWQIADRICGELSTKELQDALDPLLTDGWLELDPMNDCATNRICQLDLRPGHGTC